MSEMNVIDSKIEGVVNVYWKNGNLQQTANYTNSVLNGVLTDYDEAGEVTLTETWVDGIPNDLPSPPE